ncbi:hypothetical protein FB451DRAFT_1222687 [Mycena latifolia]|nr:hypothetical protein FB451DRAFT_1222687 [Mycena latifolia]
MMDWRRPVLTRLLAVLHAPHPHTQALVDTVRASLADCDDVGEHNREKITQIDLLIAEAHANLANTDLGRAQTDSEESLLAETVFCWRCLHTDACLLAALVSPPADAIAKLDTAIIRRLDLILDSIQRIQSEHWPSPAVPNITSCVSNLPPPPLLPAPVIPSRPTPPSLGAFQARDHAAPFILRDYARHWPAFNERPWASIDYLRAVAGPGRIVPVEVGSDYRADDWSQRLVPWDTFLTSLDSGGEMLYLAQHSLLMQFPALRADIEVPDYVYADLPRPRALVINLWLGPKGTVSPAHTDPYFNMYVQVVGRKTVWVAPPSCAEGMYATGNTAGVDVFATDQGDHPKFSEHVVGRGLTASLGPGDVLYLPAGWWHAMRAESLSTSISMWF